MLKKIIASSRYIVAAAAVGAFLASLLLLIVALAQTIGVVSRTITNFRAVTADPKELTLVLVTNIDLFLLSAGFYIIALGFYELFVDQLGDLPRHALLNLQAPGVDFDNAWNLRQADHLAAGNVGDMGLAEEGQHVVLAHRVHLDVADDHQLVGVAGEHRVVDQRTDVLAIAAGQEVKSLGRAFRRLDQAFTLHILAEQRDDVAKAIGHLLDDLLLVVLGFGGDGLLGHCAGSLFLSGLW